MKTQSVYYRMQLGDFEVTAITDGTLPLPYDQMLFHITPGEFAQLVADGFNTLPVETSVNAYLINTGSKLILVDAGAGSHELAGKEVLFSGGGVQLFPGITTIAAHGHAPGHTLYAVESKGRRLVIAGDLLHVAEVQLPRPEVTISF